MIPQNLIEFWNVATRPVENNGFGWPPSKTNIEISKVESFFTILSDRQTIYDEWKKLALGNHVIGKQVHDARLVAAMNVYNITHLLTFNDKDFRRYKHISILNPFRL